MKVWTALLSIGFWFFACFSLIAYRLRSDDLELMEREVYEELKMKKEVERFMSKSKREDDLQGKDASPIYESERRRVQRERAELKSIMACEWLGVGEAVGVAERDARTPSRVALGSTS